MLHVNFRNGLIPALIVHENVAFQEANEIAHIRSKWLSTFINDLKPSENLVYKLSEDLGKARLNAHISEQFYNFLSKQDYKRIIKGLKGETVALQNDQHTLVEKYIELHAIHTKMKRSLIPIIGKDHNYLSGTDIASHLNTIHSSVSRLAKSEEQIAHVVKENISVINITGVEMSKNRKALNKVIESLPNLD